MLEGRTPPSLTETLYSVKGQLYSELEGGATPHSYSLKRGSQNITKSSEKKKMWEMRKEPDPKQTIS